MANKGRPPKIGPRKYKGIWIFINEYYVTETTTEIIIKLVYEKIFDNFHRVVEFATLQAAKKYIDDAGVFRQTELKCEGQDYYNQFYKEKEDG